LAWLFLAPAGFLVCLVIGLPLLRAAQLSLTDTQLLSIKPPDFVGVSNFVRLLGDSGVLRAVTTSVVYVATTVTGGLILGMALAQLLERLSTRWSWLRAVLLTPWIMPAVVVALLFLYMFDARVSVVSSILQSTGLISKYPAWLTTTSLALPVVITATIWTQAPIFMLFASAALRGIPSEIRDAAKVDGASGWASFRHITVPLTKRVLLVVTILMTIQNLNGFPLVWGLTQGGPVDSTTTTVIKIYRTAFQDHELGYAAAIGMLLLVVTLIASGMYVRVMRQAE
jgi:multiple sugar transport system permease protein